MTRPLPIRVEPIPGEAWHGYLRRTALALGVQQPMELLAAFLTTVHQARRALRMRRSLGVAATPETYTRLSTHFHLHDHEIRSMFLEYFKTISCRWDATHRERLDPLAQGDLGTVWAPAVRSHKALAHCPSCRSEDPHHWSLTWLTTCQVICPHHGLWLTPANSWDRLLASPDETSVQAQILMILAGDGDCVPWTEPDTFIADLLIIATNWTGRQDTFDTLIPAGRHLLNRPGSTPISSHVRRPIEHRVAENRTTHDLNFAWGDPLRSRVILDLTRLPDPPDYAVLVRYREVPTPRPGDLSTNPAHYPELLPIDLYCPNLILLCGDMPITRGRGLCAAAARHLGIGPPWGQGHRLTQPIRPLAHLQAALEQAGHLEDFWHQITEAARALTHSAIDYTTRSQALTPETLAAVTVGAPALPPRDVEGWLHLYWACRRPQGRPETADLAMFHIEHGEQLEALTTQVMARP